MTANATRLVGGLAVIGLVWAVRIGFRLWLPAAVEPVQVAPSVAPAVVAEIPPVAFEEPPAPAKTTPAEAARPARPKTPLVRREILAPTGAMKDEASWSIASFKHVTVNANGTRLLTVSERDIICWDVATGRALQTFRRGSHWKTPTFASPDAGTVIVFDRDKKTIVVKNAETGNVVGTYAAKKEVLAQGAGVPGFTAPGGEFVFVEPADRHAFNVHAVSTRTGAGRVLARGLQLRGPKGDLNPHHLFPVPGGSTLLTQLTAHDRGTPPQSVYALGLTDGKSWPVTWLGERQPRIDFPGGGIRFSPDGRRVAFRKDGRVTLADWPTGAHEVSFPADGQYRYKHSPVFTPDGKRLVVLDVWDRQWKIIHLGQAGPERGNDRLQLFDLATNAKIAEIDETEFPGANGVAADVTLSGDGKVLVLRHNDRVWVVDFQRAFGVAP